MNTPAFPRHRLSLIGVLCGLVSSVAETIVRAAPYAEAYLAYENDVQSIMNDQRAQDAERNGVGQIYEDPGVPDLPNRPGAGISRVLEVALGQHDAALVEAARFKLHPVPENINTVAMVMFQRGLGELISEPQTPIHPNRYSVAEGGGPHRYTVQWEISTADDAYLRTLATRLGPSGAHAAAAIAIRHGAMSALGFTGHKVAIS